jgi:hypothetical protein
MAQISLHCWEEYSHENLKTQRYVVNTKLTQARRIFSEPDCRSIPIGDGAQV